MTAIRITLIAPILFALCGCGSEPNADAPVNDATAARPVPDGPNVIVISIDTLRADHLGCYGYDRPTSPTLDRLAEGGVLFENVSSTSPWTLPAHASLMTGLYPSRHGLKSHREYLHQAAVPMAEILQEQGYLTAAIVNAHYVSQRYGFDRGFDEFNYVPEELARAAPSAVEDYAVGWLSNHDGGPFFLFLHYYDVHSDYRSLPQYERMFARDYMGSADGSTAQLLEYRRGRFKLDQPDAEHLIDLYDAGVRQMDDGIARLVDLLEAKNLLDDTLIVVTSDHGEEFLEHGGVLHGRTHFEEVIRVPLIVCGPGAPQGRRVTEIASLVDVLPTTLGLLGVTPPETIDGLDLSPFWQAEPPPAIDRLVFAEADHHNQYDDIKRAVRRGKFKMHFDRSTRNVELFDLADDPGETKNVAREHATVVRELRRELDVFMATQRPGGSLAPLSQQQVEKLKSLGYLE